MYYHATLTTATGGHHGLSLLRSSVPHGRWHILALCHSTHLATLVCWRSTSLCLLIIHLFFSLHLLVTKFSVIQHNVKINKEIEPKFQCGI